MQLKEYSVLTHCLREVTVKLNFESCVQVFFTMKYRICLLFVVGVVYFIIWKVIINSISNSFLRFMFLILPQKYSETVKCDIKISFSKNKWYMCCDNPQKIHCVFHSIFNY